MATQIEIQVFKTKKSVFVRKGIRWYLKHIGSYSTALANGMKKVKEYQDPKNTISYAYAITREEWKKMKEN